jgi:hypothetical protein
MNYIPPTPLFNYFFGEVKENKLKGYPTLEVILNIPQKNLHTINANERIQMYEKCPASPPYTF